MGHLEFKIRAVLMGYARLEYRANPNVAGTNFCESTAGTVACTH